MYSQSRNNEFRQLINHAIDNDDPELMFNTIRHYWEHTNLTTIPKENATIKNSLNPNYDSIPMRVKAKYIASLETSLIYNILGIKLGDNIGNIASFPCNIISCIANFNSDNYRDDFHILNKENNINLSIAGDKRLPFINYAKGNQSKLFDIIRNIDNKDKLISEIKKYEEGIEFLKIFNY